jgi:hypothetical protein
MKPFVHPLERLLKAAARGRRELPVAVPLRVEVCALAAWRCGRRGDLLAFLPLPERRVAGWGAGVTANAGRNSHEH